MERRSFIRTLQTDHALSRRIQAEIPRVQPDQVRAGGQLVELGLQTLVDLLERLHVAFKRFPVVLHAVHGDRGGHQVQDGVHEVGGDRARQTAKHTHPYRSAPSLLMVGTGPVRVESGKRPGSDHRRATARALTARPMAGSYWMKPSTANGADDAEHMPHAPAPHRAAPRRTAPHTGAPHTGDGDRAGRAREAAQAGRGVWVKRWSLAVPDAGPRRTGAIDPDPVDPDPVDPDAVDPDAATAAGTALRPTHSR